MEFCFDEIWGQVSPIVHKFAPVYSIFWSLYTGESRADRLKDLPVIEFSSNLSVPQYLIHWLDVADICGDMVYISNLSPNKGITGLRCTFLFFVKKII